MCKAAAATERSRGIQSAHNSDALWLFLTHLQPSPRTTICALEACSAAYYLTIAEKRASVAREDPMATSNTYRAGAQVQASKRRLHTSMWPTPTGAVHQITVVGTRGAHSRSWPYRRVRRRLPGPAACLLVLCGPGQQPGCLESRSRAPKHLPAVVCLGQQPDCPGKQPGSPCPAAVRSAPAETPPALLLGPGTRARQHPCHCAGTCTGWHPEGGACCLRRPSYAHACREVERPAEVRRCCQETAPSRRAAPVPRQALPHHQTRC